ncbi:unnamed protein product [Vitrella brassicaformis CCMP3155]|uniref:Uncharacterized protein n=3 Tax=Vitrella brassicaformis TaxID=1169539 RepID=A0A0G4GYH6_VITBC|nr:unnamed protein product [Vitrella brassicaformis CCMP3155]|eukprot:CEM36175.1 unnamed protein product [Vitrella brassicaformis CCMP3155]
MKLSEALERCAACTPEKIALNGCDISVIDPVPLSFTNCTRLQLSQNQISSLQGLSQFRSLKKLALSHNLITDARQLDCIPNRLKLEYISLIGNPIANFPDYKLRILTLFPSLKELDGFTVTNEEREDVRDASALGSLIVPFAALQQRRLERLASACHRLALKRELYEAAHSGFSVFRSHDCEPPTVEEELMRQQRELGRAVHLPCVPNLRQDKAIRPWTLLRWICCQAADFPWDDASLTGSHGSRVPSLDLPIAPHFGLQLNPFAVTISELLAVKRHLRTHLLSRLPEGYRRRYAQAITPNPAPPHHLPYPLPSPTLNVPPQAAKGDRVVRTGDVLAGLFPYWRWHYELYAGVEKEVQLPAGTVTGAACAVAFMPIFPSERAFMRALYEILDDQRQQLLALEKHRVELLRIDTSPLLTHQPSWRRPPLPATPMPAITLIKRTPLSYLPPHTPPTTPATAAATAAAPVADSLLVDLSALTLTFPQLMELPTPVLDRLSLSELRYPAARGETLKRIKREKAGTRHVFATRDRDQQLTLISGADLEKLHDLAAARHRLEGTTEQLLLPPSPPQTTLPTSVDFPGGPLDAHTRPIERAEPKTTTIAPTVPSVLPEKAPRTQQQQQQQEQQQEADGGESERYEGEEEETMGAQTLLTATTPMGAETTPMGGEAERVGKGGLAWQKGHTKAGEHYAPRAEGLTPDTGKDTDKAPPTFGISPCRGMDPESQFQPSSAPPPDAKASLKLPPPSFADRQATDEQSIVSDTKAAPDPMLKKKTTDSPKNRAPSAHPMAKDTTGGGGGGKKVPGPSPSRVLGYASYRDAFSRQTTMGGRKAAMTASAAASLRRAVSADGTGGGKRDRVARKGGADEADMAPLEQPSPIRDSTPTATRQPKEAKKPSPVLKVKEAPKAAPAPAPPLAKTAPTKTAQPPPPVAKTKATAPPKKTAPKAPPPDRFPSLQDLTTPSPTRERPSLPPASDRDVDRMRGVEVRRISDDERAPDLEYPPPQEEGAEEERGRGGVDIGHVPKPMMRHPRDELPLEEDFAFRRGHTEPMAMRRSIRELREELGRQMSEIAARGGGGQALSRPHPHHRSASFSERLAELKADLNRLIANSSSRSSSRQPTARQASHAVPPFPSDSPPYSYPPRPADRRLREHEEEAMGPGVIPPHWASYEGYEGPPTSVEVETFAYGQPGETVTSVSVRSPSPPAHYDTEVNVDVQSSHSSLPSPRRSDRPQVIPPPLPAARASSPGLLPRRPYPPPREYFEPMDFPPAPDSGHGPWQTPFQAVRERLGLPPSSSRRQPGDSTPVAPAPGGGYTNSIYYAFQPSTPPPFPPAADYFHIDEDDLSLTPSRKKKAACVTHHPTLLTKMGPTPPQICTVYMLQANGGNNGKQPTAAAGKEASISSSSLGSPQHWESGSRETGLSPGVEGGREDESRDDGEASNEDTSAEKQVSDVSPETPTAAPPQPALHVLPPPPFAQPAPPADSVAQSIYFTPQAGRLTADDRVVDELLSPPQSEPRQPQPSMSLHEILIQEGRQRAMAQSPYSPPAVQSPQRDREKECRGGDATHAHANGRVPVPPSSGPSSPPPRKAKPDVSDVEEPRSRPAESPVITRRFHELDRPMRPDGDALGGGEALAMPMRREGREPLRLDEAAYHRWQGREPHRLTTTERRLTPPGLSPPYLRLDGTISPRLPSTQPSPSPLIAAPRAHFHRPLTIESPTLPPPSTPHLAIKDKRARGREAAKDRGKDTREPRLSPPHEPKQPVARRAPSPYSALRGVALDTDRQIASARYPSARLPDGGSGPMTMRSLREESGRMKESRNVGVQVRVRGAASPAAIGADVHPRIRHPPPGLWRSSLPFERDVCGDEEAMIEKRFLAETERYPCCAELAGSRRIVVTTHPQHPSRPPKRPIKPRSRSTSRPRPRSKGAGSRPRPIFIPTGTRPASIPRDPPTLRAKSPAPAATAAAGRERETGGRHRGQSPLRLAPRQRVIVENYMGDGLPLEEALERVHRDPSVFFLVTMRGNESPRKR